MIPPWLTESENVKVLGFPMSQNRLSVPAWSYAMEKYPPARIIELGSYNGGFALCLGFHARQINCAIHSFDICKCPSEGWEHIAAYTGVNFSLCDVLKEPQPVANLIIQPGRTFLLCDNGNKIEEFKLFAPCLKPGDVIAAHDYYTDYWQAGAEITPEAVAETVIRLRLMRWMPEVFNMCGWLAYMRS